MSDQLKLAAATNEMDSRGTPLADEVEGFLKDEAGESSEPDESFNPNRMDLTEPWKGYRAGGTWEEMIYHRTLERLMAMSDEEFALEAHRMGEFGDEDIGDPSNSGAVARRMAAREAAIRRGTTLADEVEGFLEGGEEGSPGVVESEMGPQEGSVDIPSGSSDFAALLTAWLGSTETQQEFIARGFIDAHPELAEPWNSEAPGFGQNLPSMLNWWGGPEGGLEDA
jgi:hypothetical protein